MQRVFHGRAGHAVISAWLIAIFTLCTPLVASATMVTGFVRQGGSPAQGVYSVAWGYDSALSEWQPVGWGVSAGDGTWAMDLPAGTYRFSFEDWDFERCFPGVFSGLSVNSGYDADVAPILVGSGVDVVVGSAPVSGIGADLGLTPLAFAGRVSGPGGIAVAGAEVTAWAFDSATGGWTVRARSTHARSDGTYELRGLIPGTYRIGATDPDANAISMYFGGATSVSAATDIGFWGIAAYGVDIAMRRVAFDVVSHAGRYGTSVAIAYKQFGGDLVAGVPPALTGVHTVVIASGEDRAMADPLAAAGLCYAYQVTDPASPNAYHNAPLLLVQSTAVPAEVKAFITKVGAENGSPNRSVQVVVVGGTTSVPQARLSEIASYAAAQGVSVTFSRIRESGDRYDLAATIAGRMKERADADPSDSIDPPSFALVANGADTNKFFDALALSPVSANTGAPILLAKYKAAPAVTLGILNGLGIGSANRYIGGGPATISEATRGALGVPAGNRMSGADRYYCALAIANTAISKGWLAGDGVGVAPKLHDALIGGSMVGDFGWPLLLLKASPAQYPAPTGAFIDAYRREVTGAFLFDGDSVVPASIRSAMGATLAAP